MKAEKTEKTDRKEQVQELTKKLEDGITALFESDRYLEYLTIMARFHHYSYRNTLLILLQCPDATLVAGFHAWKQKFHRHVKKGETGICILAPMAYKYKKESKKQDQEVVILEPESEDTKHTKKAEQSEELEEKSGQRIVGFRVVRVFDVTQTEGKELPQLGVDELTGAVTDYEVLIQALLMVSPMPVSFIEIESGAKGYCNVTKRVIAIQKDMSQLQTVKTMIHEIAHAMLHADNDKVERKDAGTREVEAESIAYVVCQYLGLDTSDYSFAYLIGWSSGRQMPELRASLHTIQTTAADLIDRIEEQISQTNARKRKAESEDSSQETSDVAGDYFEIYQLKENMENRQFYFMDLSFWQSRGLPVEHTRYDVTYTASLDEKTTLDDIYCRFNIDRPSDFFGHSLSVSDVVVLHRKGKTDSYFVDNIGFQPVTDFFKKEPKDVAV